MSVVYGQTWRRDLERLNTYLHTSRKRPFKRALEGGASLNTFAISRKGRNAGAYGSLQMQIIGRISGPLPLRFP